jgi:hypothetical protein
MAANSAESNNEQRTANAQSQTSPEVVADWLMLYAQAYREEITEELVLFYQEALKDLPPRILHLAFLRAGKNCKFRPTPVEIREAAEIEFEKEAQSRPRLPEPQLSPEEREAALKETEAFREKLKEVLRPKQKASPVTSIAKQKEELKKRGYL